MASPGSLSLRAGVALSDLDLLDCWIEFMAMGGHYSYADYAHAVLTGTPLDGAEHDMAAHALNESLDDRGLGHPVAYQADLARE